LLIEVGDNSELIKLKIYERIVSVIF